MNVGVFSEDKSNFMVYFFLLSIVSIMAYLVFHNKQKVGWLDYWLVGWIIGWLDYWLAGWIIGFLVGLLVDWLVLVWFVYD